MLYSRKKFGNFQNHGGLMHPSAGGRMQEPAESWVAGGPQAAQIPVAVALQLQAGAVGGGCLW